MLANKHALIFISLTIGCAVANSVYASNPEDTSTKKQSTSTPSAAIKNKDKNPGTELTMLKPIVIQASEPAGGTIIEDHEPIASINQTGLDRILAKDVYEAIDSIAGVSSFGGPRTHSRNISIRGFANNEDVLIRVDGASQNFEKYRFGSGILLEPELLKTVSVHKGSPGAAYGSGTIGGAVIVETKDAFDFLPPGENIGAHYKLGYNSNDNGNLASVNLFARPSTGFGMLAHATQRNSEDKKLANGDIFPESDESQTSGLLKLNWQQSSSSLAIAYRTADESGEEPFDASAGPNGIGGLVDRTTRERSPTINFKFNPNKLINLQASFGRTDKTITDKGGSFFQDATGTFDYLTDDANIANTSVFIQKDISFSMTYGIQAHQQDRMVTRTNNITGITTSYEPQPSGQRKYTALYLQNELFIGNLSLSFGIREDDYTTKSMGLAAEILNQQGRRDSNQFNLTTRNASLGYTIGPTLIFYRYKEAFRVPLTDESYALGITSNCEAFNFFIDQPVPPDFNDFRAQFPNVLDALAAFNQALADYEQNLNEFIQSPFARSNAACGDLYRPELSQTQELGFSFNNNNIFSYDDSLLLKLTYFHTDVNQLLESIYQDSTSGEIIQQGIENSKGFELEVAYYTPVYFVNLAFDKLDGFQDLRYYTNNIDTRILNTPENNGRQALFNKAPEKTALTIGRAHNRLQLTYGYTYEKFNSRKVSTGFRTENGCGNAGLGNPACLVFGTEPAYTLHSLFLEWRPSKHTQLNINIDNATNEEYNFIDTFGGTGFTGTGRDIRIAFSQKF